MAFASLGRATPFRGDKSQHAVEVAGIEHVLRAQPRATCLSDGISDIAERLRAVRIRIASEGNAEFPRAPRKTAGQIETGGLTVDF